MWKHLRFGKKFTVYSDPDHDLPTVQLLSSAALICLFSLSGIGIVFPQGVGVLMETGGYNRNCSIGSPSVNRLSLSAP